MLNITNSLKSLAKSLDGVYKSQLLSLMYDQYAPTAKSCINLWVNEMTEKLINYESRYNDNAVFLEISKFSPEQSQSIVDRVNITSSEDNVRKQLLDAFKKCPYNEDIYFKAAQAGVLDRDTFEYAASNYGYEESIQSKTKKFCSKNLDDIELVKKQIAYMIRYGCTEENILQEIYTPFVSGIIKKFESLKEWTEPQRRIKSFIVLELNIPEVITFVNMDDSAIREKLDTCVSNIVTQKCWNTLVDNNLIEWRKVSLNSTSDYMSMKTYYIDLLLKKIMEYHSVMSDAKEQYMKADKEYTEKCNLLNSGIVKLEGDISQLGVFSFKKKKALTEELEAQKSAYYNFSNRNKPDLHWL